MKPPRGLIRVAWGAYALLLFGATHWPQVQIPGQEYRADVVIHMAAFGLWSALFIACGWFGPALSWRNISHAGVIAPIYAGLDELSQGVPGIGRVVDALDAVGNLTGAVLATLVALIAARVRGAEPPDAPMNQ